MKKLVALILMLSILTLVGCSKLGIESESNELISSEMVSSKEETDTAETSSESISSETTTSASTTLSENINITESKEENSSSGKITSSKNTSSKTASKPTSSKKDTSSTTPKPTTYFEKHNLKLSPHDTKICFNKDAEHKCADKMNIVVKRSEKLSDFTEEEMFKGTSLNFSSYTSVVFNISSDTLNECTGGLFTNVIPFDKYTGTIFTDDYCVWKKLKFNKTEISIYTSAGGNIYNSTKEVICPKNYDGVMFAVVDNDSYRDITMDGKNHTIDEVINFKKDKYYLFSLK